MTPTEKIILQDRLLFVQTSIDAFITDFLENIGANEMTISMSKKASNQIENLKKIIENETTTSYSPSKDQQIKDLTQLWLLAEEDLEGTSTEYDKLKQSYQQKYPNQ